MTSNMLLPLMTYPDACGDGALRYAVSVASRLEARLAGLAVEVDIPRLGNPLAEVLMQLGDRIKEVEQKSRRAAHHLSQELQALGRRAGIDIETQTVRSAPAFMADAVLGAARFSDLIVLPHQAESLASAEIAEPLIFQSGRPVLLVPDAWPGEFSLESIVVATDFGRTATRALFDALPLLRRARRIDIIRASDEKDLSKGNEEALNRFIEIHGLKARLVDITSGGIPIGETLMNYATGIGADALVMGAFGHSRFREFVLGGATRSVLISPRLPVFMSH